MICCSISFALKKANGKHIQAPSIELSINSMKRLLKEFRIKSLVADGFVWRNSMRTRPGTLQQLLGRSNYLSKNIEKNLILN